MEVLKTFRHEFKYVISYVLENGKDEMKFLDNFVEKGLIEKLEKYDKETEVAIDIPGEICDRVYLDTDSSGKEYVMLE